MAFKALPANALKLNVGGHEFAEYFAWLEDNVALEDIFPSTYWMHYQAKLRVLDIVRLRRRDGSFDQKVTIMSQADNGELLVEPWPKYRDAGEMSQVEAAIAAKDVADKSRPSVVPLGNDGEPAARVEFLEATRWRVRGWNGQEVSRDHASETIARKALERYLKQLNMVMPTAAEIEAGKAKLAAKKAKAA